MKYLQNISAGFIMVGKWAFRVSYNMFLTLDPYQRFPLPHYMNSDNLLLSIIIPKIIFNKELAIRDESETVGKINNFLDPVIEFSSPSDTRL